MSSEFPLFNRGIIAEPPALDALIRQSVQRLGVIGPFSFPQSQVREGNWWHEQFI